MSKKISVKIENVVAKASLDHHLDLDSILRLSLNTAYEPEQFPGLIYRMKTPKVVMLLFSTGKTICTQARKEEDVATAGNILQKILESKDLISYE